MMTTFLHARSMRLPRTCSRRCPATLSRWKCLTPLGRNEFICWIEDAKQPATRPHRIVGPAGNCWRAPEHRKRKRGPALPEVTKNALKFGTSDEARLCIDTGVTG